MGLDYEQIRLSYKPDEVKVLLVGEVRPASGDFFYTVDSLTHYMQRAFAEVFEEAANLRGVEFLEYFKARGFYLDNLVRRIPGEISGSLKAALCNANVPFLAEKISRWKQRAVVAMMMRIGSYVSEAVERSGVETEFCAVHYGGNGQQNKYVRELVIFLKDAGVKGII